MLKMKGIAGVYVGWEQHTDEPKIVSRSWFRELAPPWRVGHGRRVRLGHRAFQVGVYKKVKDENTTALSQLGGRELPFQPQDISGWQGPSKVNSET